MIRIPGMDENRPMRSTVLIVDDTATARAIITITLDSLGFHTIPAADGSAALSILQRCQPDAIVTDLEMPKVSGDELLSAVRNSEISRIRELPVLVISSKVDRATRSRISELGADGFLSKPVDVNALSQAAERIFIDV